MPGITNGAELVRRLAEGGTGKHKLECARDCLRAAKMNDRRVATAAEVVAALQALLGPTNLTVVKARALAETGVWAGPPRAEDAQIEDELLGGRAAVVVAPAAPPVPGPTADDAKAMVARINQLEFFASSRADELARQAADHAQLKAAFDDRQAQVERLEAELAAAKAAATEAKVDPPVSPPEPPAAPGAPAKRPDGRK